MAQIYLRMNTAEVQRNINGYGTGSAASAVGCIDKLQDIFDEIERGTAHISTVWDDDAQRIFTQSFRDKRSQVAIYLGGLRAFLEETYAAVETVKEWDSSLASKLHSL